MRDLALLVSSFATLITAIGSLVIGIRNTRKIELVHKATNSMKDELVRSTAKASEAEGHAAGLQQGRGEKR